MTKRNNRIGEIHGIFKVSNYEGSKNGQSLWGCICLNCGSYSIRYNRYFRKDRPIPKCCTHCDSENHPHYKGINKISGTYLSRIKKQAGKRKIEFQVTPEYLWALYVKQKYKCYLTGIRIKFGKNQTASLDRVDSSKPYEKGNVAWCHKDVNKLKGTFDIRRFIQLCNQVKKIPNVPKI